MSDDCTHGHPHGTGYPCTACLDERIAQLTEMWELEREAVKNVTEIVGEVTRERDAALLQLSEAKRSIRAAHEGGDRNCDCAWCAEKPPGALPLEERVNNRQHLLERCFLELYVSMHDERAHKREDCLKAARAIAERIAGIDNGGEKPKCAHGLVEPTGEGMQMLCRDCGTIVF